MNDTLPNTLYKELQQELEAITRYWVNYSVDEEFGGFVGQRNHKNELVEKSNKGIILNARILWSFSAIANYSKQPELHKLMDRAFTYLHNQFRDKEHGGVFWKLNYTGKPVVKKKQIYAQAFVIYGLAEYYTATKNEDAKAWAIELFNRIEKHAYDKEHAGYIEAFEEDWSPINDMRLSEKDQNAAKTMNTHLHILEAYTSLLKIHPTEQVKKSLANLINLFLEKFLNTDYNFELFFDHQWNLLSDAVSYGHDIETLWLLVEGAKVTEDQELINKTKQIAPHIADRFLERGYITGKGVLNEEDRKTGHIDTDRHWWPQAEAMVGLFYANQILPKQKYNQAIVDIWEFTKKNIIDSKNGEWFFRVDDKNNPYTQEDKLGMWKCPYHNSRACIVLLENLN